MCWKYVRQRSTTQYAMCVRQRQVRYSTVLFLFHRAPLHRILINNTVNWPIQLLKLDCRLLYLNLQPGLPYHRISLAIMRACNFTIYPFISNTGRELAKCHAWRCHFNSIDLLSYAGFPWNSNLWEKATLYYMLIKVDKQNDILVMLKKGNFDVRMQLRPRGAKEVLFSLVHSMRFG